MEYDVFVVVVVVEKRRMKMNDPFPRETQCTLFHIYTTLEVLKLFHKQEVTLFPSCVDGLYSRGRSSASPRKLRGGPTNENPRGRTWLKWRKANMPTPEGTTLFI